MASAVAANRWTNYLAPTRVLDYLITGAGMIGVAATFVLSISIFVNAFGRYLLNLNMVGLFSSSIYSLMFLPFMMLAYTYRAGRHIFVDSLRINFAPRALNYLDVFIVIPMSLIFPVILGWQAWNFMQTQLANKVMTYQEVAIPAFIIYLIIVIGCALLLAQIIRTDVIKIRALGTTQNIIPTGTAHKLTPAVQVYWSSNPLVIVLSFLAGIIVSGLLFFYVSPVVGLLVFLMVALFAGVPVFLCLGLVGTIGISFVVGSGALPQVALTAYKTFSSFGLTCLPLFILGGNILARGQIVESVFNFFKSLMGGYAPSLLLSTILVGLVVSATTGSTVGAAAMLSAALIPILLKRGYDTKLCCTVIAGCGVGSLVPPSIGAIVYGELVGESIAALFIAQVLPALLLFGLLSAYVIILNKVNKKSLFEGGKIPASFSQEKVGWKEKFSTFKAAIWGLLAPPFILGGLYAGIFTSTEAAGVLVIYGLVVAVFILRVLTWRQLMHEALQAAMISAMVLMIIYAASVFALATSQLRIATQILTFIQAANLGAIPVMFALFVILTIMGLFMDASAIMVITLPVFFKAITGLGISPIWLRDFYAINLEIGLLTPPVGLTVFAIYATTGIPLTTIFKGIMPTIIIMLLVLIAICIFPGLATWLPATMGFGE